MSTPAAPSSGAYFTTVLDEAKQRLTERGQEVFDFGVGDPIEPTPEFIRQALIQALDPVSRYPTVVGQPLLREAVAGWAKRRLGVSLDPATEVIPANGSKEAIFHLPLALLRPTDARRMVVYPTPSYPVYDSGTRYAQGVEYPVALREANGYRLDLGSLPDEVLAQARIVWLNYPHNPTGASVDKTYLREQIEIARTHDILVCADECYLDLYFDESSPPPSVLQVARQGVLAFGSLSKRSGMTGYRSGYIAGDPTAIAALKRTRPNMGVGSPNFVQAAAAAAWRDDAHVAERRALFRAKRDRMAQFLRSKGYEMSGSEGAIYLWVRVPSRDPQSFFRRLLEHGIVVSPGESFGPGGEGYFRVALVPTMTSIDRALSVWDAIEFSF
ncbi:MAG: succinyldiaminopimelate transaminase [Chloroflexi bacterium]|nr:succinyldiaminopimelate transaminase [Chloroflexota bacterium]